jgi:hypothetical protein
MVGKIGAVSKRSPVKPAAKRVAKPAAKPGAKPVAKSAVKRVAKPTAKPAAKRAGVKRATPKAKKVNFNKLLIIIRNVANRTHKKGRMTGGGLEDAKNTILKYLIGSELTSAIIGLIKNDDRTPGALNTSSQEDNLILRVGSGIKKVGTGGTMVDLLTAIDTFLSVMKNANTPLVPANGNKATINLNNIAYIIAEENKDNINELNAINNTATTFNATNAATTALEAALKVATNGNTTVEINNTQTISTLPASPYDKLDDNFDLFNKSPSLAISSITSDSINTSYTSLIKTFTDINYNDTYEYILTTGTGGVLHINEKVKRDFAMLMIAITLAKIHNIIKDM